MREFAREVQQLGLQSENSVFSDLATLSAQYLRGYAAALQTYVPADNFLQLAASSSAAVITEACSAVGA